jgi:protein-arginine kinase activator protein McsA
MESKKRKSLLELFEENELQVGRLYELYSQKFPEHESFWHDLSMEESEHVASIQAMQIIESDNLIQESKFTRGVLKYVADFVKEKIQEAQKKKITHPEALEIALRIERSIIEKKCFDFFIPTDKKLESILKKLNQETESHIGRLQKEFSRQINK